MVSKAPFSLKMRILLKEKRNTGKPHTILKPQNPPRVFHRASYNLIATSYALNVGYEVIAMP